ncbi:hypothetical protein LTR62_003366 [Meristemomyces frigidus]|uniref:Uncharacterized protein n=1 Tax=Meristemomyces frigidus TaxID=1508187 RepID=A0AAN7TFL0_9PEZI|nr:hypothetical protein LTR62_003366 [Meristemomyces frigidus]
MPFTNGVSSVSGRNSRASNVSGMTGSVHSAPPPIPKSDDMFSNAGVLSMLKTSTDTGDIGALSFNHTRYPQLPQPAHQRRGHASKPSISSDLPGPSGSSHHYPGHSSHHRYAPSQTSRMSDSTSYVRRGSLTSMQSMPPSLQPVSNGKAPLRMPPPIFDKARDSRSYSMTSAPVSGQLPRHQSATSLVSAGHEPRHGPRMLPSNAPPMPEYRPLYVYPTRLKRPGYRSPSPALSDLSGHGQYMPPPMAAGGVRMPLQRPPMPTYNSDYGAQEAQFLDVHPPSRGMNSSPVMPCEQPQFTYRTNAMRSDPGLPMGHPPPQHPYRKQPMYGPAPARSGYPHQRYGPPRPTHPAYAQVQQYPAYGHHMQRGRPPRADVMPMAHSMFHNAARMARHLPVRTDTPLTDLSPPSSDPPSSGTVPSSSSPPTPKDQNALNSVEPLFIDPALTDLPDSSSEPVLNAKYFAYADGLEKTLDEPDLEIPHPSMAPTGFVQRVKAMLESRAAVEAAAKKNDEWERAAAGPNGNRLEMIPSRQENDSELIEMDATEEPRFVVLEEFDAPVELPASPIKPVELAELSASPPPPRHELRLTREMVKTRLAASSTVQDSSEEMTTTDTAEVDTRTDLEHQASGQTTSPKLTTSTRESETPKLPPGSNLDTHGVHRQPSTATSAATASPGLISGIDYALRFSAPMDTTIATTETRSKDPFGLDADTITLQHQRSKEQVVPPSETKHDMDEGKLRAEISSTPISPLMTGENVVRYSAVSPLRTHTAGIDETLQAADTSMNEEGQEIEQNVQVDAPSGEGSLPPPTPRTPKTYSKSVQLPHTSFTMTDTPSTNRYSLPPDLSTVGETTMNTNSDMIADVAVRFSLPTTSITIGKPQIVTIPPSSSPERQESPPPLPMKCRARGLQPRSANRNSVTFADEVAPLNVNKVGSMGKGKSIMRHPSPLDESFGSGRATSSRESTMELRFLTNNGINSRFGSIHLPGLKEESIDDMSISDKQKQHRGPTESQQLTLPARIAAVKAMQERRLQESAGKAKARRAARHHNRSLTEARDLPSLNFSRMDLIDKLNEALEIRPSKSLEVVRRRDFSGIYCPSPQRPLSTEPLRERYMSFFSKPEDFSTFFDGPSIDDLDDEHPFGSAIPTVEVQQSTRIESASQLGSAANSKPGSRALSPEDLLSVTTQVNRLSIPSVTGLSDKLTSILPALRNLQLDSILSGPDGFAQVLEDLHNFGGSRPETILSTRTSAGFRTLAERAEEIVLHGTHDSVVPVSRLLLMNKELPPLPESASADKVSSISPLDEKQAYLSGSVSAPVDLGKDFTCPASTSVRQKSPVSEEEVRQLLPPEMNPITRGKRSLIISSASRPWNQDENYPWTGKDVPVDLTIPSETHTRESVIRELHRKAKSVDFTTTLQSSGSTAGIDIGSIYESGEGTASITTEQATGISTTHAHKASKRSIIGSLTKKISIPGYGKRATDDTTVSLSPLPGSDVTLAHKPGDRYPTSALTPPVNLQLDEVRSFFSDNSSERQRRTHSSFRKRLTGISRNKIKSVRLDGSNGVRSRGGSLDNMTAYDAGSLNAELQRTGVVSAAETVDGIGMGKAEFKIKRFGERLRHLWCKGGDLIRTLSGRGNRVQRVGAAREDWLSDSSYRVFE